MNREKASHLEINARNVILLIAVVAVVMCITGCGNNQMTRIKENQASLQTLVEENARQMSDVAARMEQNQKELQVTIKNLRETTQKLSTDMAYVTTAHTELQKSIQDNNKAMLSRVVSVERSQQAMSKDISEAASEREKLMASINAVANKSAVLEDVVHQNNETLVAKVSTIEDNQVKLQTELKTVQAGIQAAVADIKAIAKVQMNLEKAVTGKVAEQIATVQEDQKKQQADIDNAHKNINQVMSNLANLEKNLTQLEQLLASETKSFSEAIELISQKQIQAEDKAKRDVRGLTGSINTIEQKQNDLNKQLEKLQNNTKTMMDNLKTDLERVRSAMSRVKPLEVAKNDSPTSKAIAAEPNKETAASQ